jgi:hypothetical protein
MRSTITSIIGDVMTKEVDAVTGALEVAMHTGAQDIEVAVRYFGADERYTVWREARYRAAQSQRLVTSQAPRDAPANRAPADDAGEDGGRQQRAAS